MGLSIGLLDLFNVDFLVDFAHACEVYGRAGKCFKGNLHPVADLLESTPERCQQAAFDRLQRARGLRYMLGAGCEVPAAVSDEVFSAFCQTPARDAAAFDLGRR